MIVNKKNPNLATKPKQIKTPKVPEVFEEFLFLNPDCALAYNNLEYKQKIAYISAVKKCKTQRELEVLFLSIKTELESQNSETV